MNQYLQEYIKLKKNFEECDGNKASVVALYEFADRLVKCSEQEAKKVLVDVYRILGLMKSAFRLFRKRWEFVRIFVPLSALRKTPFMGRCGLAKSRV